MVTRFTVPARRRHVPTYRKGLDRALEGKKDNDLHDTRSKTLE
jgi:hypothetical protein